MKTIITTAGRPDKETYQLAVAASDILGYPVIERRKRSVRKMQDTYSANVLVAGKDRYEYFVFGSEEPFFFHPNSAAFRLKRMLKGETDPLIEVSQLKPGDSFLDCTLGLASDSIIASYVTGISGLVEGVEADPSVAFITTKGLQAYKAKLPELSEAMRRIRVIHGNAIEHLKSQPDCSWDIVYVDTMFSAPIEESTNFASLRTAGMHSKMTEVWMEQALRVCRRRVVVKDHYDSDVFEEFRLNRVVRPNTKFHFGYADR
ncbi:class I SAM-dependent methyltransferase [Sporosarcina sp. Te-1]|uniref:class I SAM-dependent methyltransferase n=1 Tax=Sporosarcina sp. Te-1 TaxID=2818390 RepID=UPI001FB19C42|nr:class I SAM-dependent methyltransferase [Sporosarcina sp. Te-1]